MKKDVGLNLPIPHRILLSSSLIQDIQPYLSSDYGPGSQGISIEEALYCIVFCTLTIVGFAAGLKGSMQAHVRI